MGKNDEIGKLYIVTNSDNEERVKETLTEGRLRADWEPSQAKDVKAFVNVDTDLKESMKKYMTRMVPDSYYRKIKVKDNGTTSKKDN